MADSQNGSKALDASTADARGTWFTHHIIYRSVKKRGEN